MSKGSNGLKRNLKALNRIKSELYSIKKSAEDAADEVEKQSPKKIADVIERICWSTIVDWYDSYSPTSYKRTESLFRSYHVFSDKGYIEFKLNADDLDGHNDNNEYIYNLTIVEGWHGGALDGENHPNPGFSYWRYPSPYYGNWWPTAAPRSFSPLERILEEIHSEDFSGIVQSIFKKSYYKFRRR